MKNKTSFLKRPKNAKWKIKPGMRIYLNKKDEPTVYKRAPKGLIQIGEIFGEQENDNKYSCSIFKLI